MKRFKPYRVKSEKPETSSAGARDSEEHDLAYYIHDRVELMHQVFSVLKHKELRAIAPECVRRLSIDDLQELCTEELLGISSKRLLAILDGAAPPSDTESSSSEPLETVSLDSISSGEELLSHDSGARKKHKHKRSSKKHKRRTSTTSKPPKAQPTTTTATTAQASTATLPSHAGVTVLELLELQARARAIRAQLQQHGNVDTAGKSPVRADDDDVMIKEEPPEVVEISSDDDSKPKITPMPSTSKTTVENGHTATDNEKNKETAKSKEKKKKKNSKKKDKQIDSEKEVVEKDNSVANVAAVEKVGNPTVASTVTKKINDLVITVPQQHTRKIKLNRTKSIVHVDIKEVNVATVEKVAEKIAEAVLPEKEVENVEVAKKQKAKKDKKKKRKSVDNKEGSDHDEITLQLSDSEKMDLLEDFNYDKVTSSTDTDSSSDSESDSSSSQSGEEETVKTKQDGEELARGEEAKNDKVAENDKVIDADKDKVAEDDKIAEVNETAVVIEEGEREKADVEDVNKPEDRIETVEIISAENVEGIESNEINKEISSTEGSDTNMVVDNKELQEESIVIRNIDDIPIQEDTDSESHSEKAAEITEVEQDKVTVTEDVVTVTEKVKTGNETREKVANIDDGESQIVSEIAAEDLVKETEKDKEKEISDGEISEHSSSEVEALTIEPEVVCISDDEVTQKKKKKKDKKAKKDKKKKSDFREASDQNFFKEVNVKTNEQNADDESTIESTATGKRTIELIVLDDDEVFELSDSSSCYEVEGTVLSKEPTVEEIEALSAKIDEIDRDKIVTDEQIRQHEMKETEKEDLDSGNISWKDRYLGSTKVKKVLSTANILNALRKKNKQLKKMVEDNKKKETEMPIEKSPEIEKDAGLEEGSIEQYNTLQGSTKYVDPVVPKEIEKEKEIEIQVTGEMKKDAKLLLKMYRKLLKYNDLTKQKDPNKKKKKKRKKEKDAIGDGKKD